MTKAYEEIIGFLAGGMTSAQLIAYQPSGESAARFQYLVQKEKTDGLLPDEHEELGRMMEVERVLSLAKARARRNCAASAVQ